jgi:kinesin family protein 5
VLRTSNNRAQQKKMAFLERNLEQLTVIQRQLVEQNNGLKKEVAIAERKLIARNERIQSLEHLLADSQEKLVQTNHRCVPSLAGDDLQCANEEYRFESQLSAVKERLEAAKAGSTRGLAALGGGAAGAPGGGPGGFPFGGARIAKPLRGGGAAATGPGADQHHPQHGFPNAAAALQAQENGGKRGGWFFG